MNIFKINKEVDEWIVDKFNVYSSYPKSFLLGVAEGILDGAVISGGLALTVSVALIAMKKFKK